MKKLLGTLFSLYLLAAPAQAQGFVRDEAHLLTDTEATQLLQYSQSVYQATGIRLALATHNALVMSPKDTAKADLVGGGLGQDGVLLLISLTPRELYIQPGSAYSGLDNTTCFTICNGVIGPKLRSGERFAAVRDGFAAIADNIVAKHSPAVANQAESNFWFWFFVILAVVVVFIFLLCLVRAGSSGYSSYGGGGDNFWLGYVLGSSGGHSSSSGSSSSWSDGGGSSWGGGDSGGGSSW